MGVRVDLYGYGIEFDLFCTTTGGGAINSAATPTSDSPLIRGPQVPGAHQINDASKVQYAASGGGVLAANSAKDQAGRRKDLNVALDHLHADEAGSAGRPCSGACGRELSRSIRRRRTARGVEPSSLTGLSFQRQALFWDAKLEVSAA